MAKIKPRYPIREWLGRFESWVLVMKGSSCMRYYDNVLEQLFTAFPNKTGVEQFTSIDIADWIKVKEQKGVQPRTLSQELSALSAFWTWMVQDKGLWLRNPIEACKKNLGIRGYYASTHKNKWSLSDIERLLRECSSTKEKRLILEVMKGARVPRGDRKARRNVMAAAQRVGLKDFNICQLKLISRNRLANDIVQTYCDKILDALPVESQPIGYTLTAIKLPTPDKWTSISDGYNYRFVSRGVVQQEPSTKGQSSVGNREVEPIIGVPISTDQS